VVTRIGHVGLRAADLETSIAHAEQTLGLRLAARDDWTAYLRRN